MRYYLFILGIILGGFAFAITSRAAQIDLVYPRVENGDKPYVFLDTVRTTFLFGNVAPADAYLEINDQKIEVTPEGAFLAYVSLDTFIGTKSFELTLIEKGEITERITFPYIFHSEEGKPQLDTISAGPFVFPLALRVSTEHAVTRTMPGGTYDLFPPLGTIFIAEGIREKFFVIDLGGGETTYIETRFVTVDSTAALESSVIGDIVVDSSPMETRLKIPMSAPNAFRSQLSTDLRVLTLSLYNSVSDINKITFDPWAGGVDLVRWRRGGVGKVEIDIRCATPIEHGFGVVPAPDGTAVEVSIRHKPGGHPNSLRGKTIIVDPGHGGAAKGSIGPLRTMEKDIVLELGKLLARELERRRAKVFLTRETDTAVGIYERVDFACEQKADLIISLHTNALPDGENPFLRHGSGTYYYQPGSRRAAETIHRRLLRATQLRDDGIFYDDLALVRPTEFPAVLVEVAYTMYPDEEKLLRDFKFLKRVAKGLAVGIQDYFRMR